MHVRKIGSRKALLKANRLLMGGMLFLCCAASAFAQPLGMIPRWTEGDAWRMEVLFRNLDGSWSQNPVTLKAQAVCDETECNTVSITDPLSGNSVAVIFNLSDFLPVRVVSTEMLRGEPVDNVVDISSRAPVYFNAGPIPVFMPLFVSDDSFGPYTLSRVQNGTRMMSVKLNQRILSGNDASAADWLPEEIRNKLPSEFEMETATWVVVTKEDESVVFKQLWGAGQPWPVYTESSNVKLWVCRP